MTAFLILTALIVLVEIVAGVRQWRHDRPTAPPPSHLDWSTGGSLPSRPYAA